MINTIIITGFVYFAWYLFVFINFIHCTTQDMKLHDKILGKDIVLALLLMLLPKQSELLYYLHMFCTSQFCQITFYFLLFRLKCIFRHRLFMHNTTFLLKSGLQGVFDYETFNCMCKKCIYDQT